MKTDLPLYFNNQKNCSILRLDVLILLFSFELCYIESNEWTTKPDGIFFIFVYFFFFVYFSCFQPFWGRVCTRHIVNVVALSQNKLIKNIFFIEVLRLRNKTGPLDLRF